MTEGHTARLEAALAGRYRPERKLGEGGMASVYAAAEVRTFVATNWFTELRARLGGGG